MMGRISDRSSTAATTAIVSLMPPDVSYMDSAITLDLAVTLPWPVATGAAARCLLRSSLAISGAL